MELSGEHTFSAPRDRVYAFLLDPDTLKACLPGCEKLEKVGEDEYAATMKIGIGMIKGTFSGRVKISDKQEPTSYRMLVEGKGPQGQLSGVGTVKFEAVSDSETKVIYDGDANVRGMLARIGSRVIQPAANMIVGKFFSELTGKMQG